MPLTTEGKAVALEALAERRAHPPKQIDNAALPAGSPTYYYCLACGALADTKPEDWFMHLPKKLCAECAALKELGWLE